MKRNTLIYVIILVVLGTLAVALIMKNRDSTLPEDQQDFAVTDTAAISRIELSDRNNREVVLERKSPGAWSVNNKFKAQPSQMDILLETIKLVQVKNPVPLASRDNVIKTMASSAVKIKIFKNDELAKTYYVGGTTPDELGTMMLLEGAREPYVTYIPGFEGYLNTRYITREQDWRTTEIYHLNPAAIEEVEVTYAGQPEASFKLSVQGEQYMLQEKGGHNSVDKLAPLSAKRYLAGYRGIDFETFARIDDKKKDSILASQPFAEIHVKSSEAKPPVLKLYLKQADDRTKGVGPNNIDQDRFYGYIEEGGNKDIVLVQNFVAGKLLPTYQELAGQ